ncbi:MAG: pyruvate dehydrogenase (acetyl-transferring) E1 component subunit alpha [Nitrospirota bacterium]
MPEKTIESINIKRIEILDQAGETDEALMPSLAEADIRCLYELLVLSRAFDQRALSLQREGRLGTYASILGQEASQVGSAYALEQQDWVFPSFRETGVHIARGYPAELLFAYWAGDERGMQAPEGLNIFPISIAVGTHIPHAVGAAMAIKYRGEKTAVAAYFGDGATSKGDFHEGFNMAGVYRLPVVFICQNNQWAISIPRERQSAARTLAQKAFAYGFEGIQVDGNDIFAVYKVTRDALRKARDGGGPTFIECHTYRMAHHTTADDSTRYRHDREVELWKPRDPLARLQSFMEKKGLWTEQYRAEAEARARTIIDDAVKKAEAMPRPDPGDMFTYTYAAPSSRQRRQQGAL